MTTESKVASTQLEKPIKVSIGSKLFDIYPPTLATLILVSERISSLPEPADRSQSVLNFVGNQSKDCRDIAKILAILIIGAKAIRDEQQSFIDRFLHRKSKLEELTDFIALNLKVKEMSSISSLIVNSLQVNDFFSSIVFLKGLNMTKPTKTM